MTWMMMRGHHRDAPPTTATGDPASGAGTAQLGPEQMAPLIPVDIDVAVTTKSPIRHEVS
ncbi:hypothetical protein H5P33_27025 [Mycolicibacterium arabiense]|uniref:hypothetical protein n=1 Tax=Mycolicibacterium arabiense TaxID=1286181 RepID=UPI0013CFB3E8|nr:hypothetical protein [Mycolicibacterium arabiense]MCV7376378.1 hypothetical protein [Mycolicibacterium arabiense]